MAKTPSTSSRKPQAKSGATPNVSSGSRTAGTGTSSKTQRNDPMTSSKSILYADETKQFFTSVQLTPRRDVFINNDAIAPLPTSSEKDSSEWCVKIGDFACIESQNADTRRKRCSPGGKASTSVSPFAVPWRPCQILALFRDRIPNKLSTKKFFGPLRVEIRWFYRYEDLDKRNRHFEKEKAGDVSSNDMVYETDHVAVVDANMLLGRLTIWHKADSNISVDSLGHPVVPTVVLSCHRYYLHDEQDVIDLYERENSLTRGLDCSDILQYKNVRKMAYIFLGLTEPNRRGDDNEGGPLVVIPKPTANIQYKEQLVAYYSSCTLPHPLSNLTHGDMVCSQRRRNIFPKWKLCVGDIVAVHCDESTPSSDVDAISGRDTWYPYRVPWSHCQVIAIFKDIHKKPLSPMSSASESIPASSLYCEIRWFPRLSEAQAECQDKQKIYDCLRDISTDTKRMSEEILEGKQTLVIHCSSLLGPISVEDESITDPNTIFLPRNRRRISNSISCDDKGKPHIGRTLIEFDPTLRVQRGLDASKRLKNCSQKVNILNEVLRLRKERSDQMPLHDELHPHCGNDNEATEVVFGDIAAEKVSFESSPCRKRQLFSNDSSEGKSNSKRVRVPSPNRNDEAESHSCRAPDDTVNGIERVNCNGQPFHIDMSAFKSFYEEMDVYPVDERFSSSGSNNEDVATWKVKLGDTIIVETEDDKKYPNAVNFPFAVPWAPAEVVSIYRLHKDKEMCAKFNKHDKLSAESKGEIMLEIRWFYRPWEIPGVSKKKQDTLDGGELEEVFETDQIDVCSAESILSPMQLHDVSRISASSNRMLGMPLIHYHCSRFWSIHRRSFVPSGSLSNRVLRGRMYSAHKAAFSELERSKCCVADASYSGEISWKADFQAAIRKLSLAAAAQDAQEKGMVLACRENERQMIASFLRKAISGLVQTNHSRGDDEEETKQLKSSLFIAGPPGTGKTASVRSVIRDLEKEQHEGLLPQFNFITLNGMELRHPFDAYVKFWEALSGPRKERLSAGGAVCELENYFCGDQKGGYSDSDSEVDDDGNDDIGDLRERPVTVLLLDEIDYLVTKKETLVYNFFDWPLRATTARLVVIGISNTINLPEKLSSRVQSRIGGDRCHFRSYNVQDTITILKTRLENSDGHHVVFEEDAINFAARKTANLSGDIRKAFHMCKVAAESVLDDYISGKRQLLEGSRPLVRIADVQKGSRDMFTSMVFKAVSCSTDFEALLLIAIGALKRGKDGSFEIKDVLTKIESIANASGEQRYMNARLSFADLLGMVNRLGDAGIIRLNFDSRSPWPCVSPNLDTFEILASYRDTRHSKLAEKHLANQRLFRNQSQA